MRITINRPETLRVENLNHPDDFHFFFEGGEFVWNRAEDKDLHIQLGSDPSNMFSIARFTLPYYAVLIIRDEIEQYKKSLEQESTHV